MDDEIKLKRIIIDVSEEFFEMMEEGIQLGKDNGFNMDYGEWIERTIFNMGDDVVALEHLLMAQKYNIPINDNGIKRESNSFKVMYN